LYRFGLDMVAYSDFGAFVSCLHGRLRPYWVIISTVSIINVSNWEILLTLRQLSRDRSRQPRQDRFWKDPFCL
jgi:hypothetical protein